MGERCEVCDRPRATDAQWRDVPPGERDDLCWGREQCEAGAVDWRERATLTRLDLAAAIARAERAEGLCAEATYALGQQGRPADLMPMAVRAVVSRADAAEARAERAEAGLAALRSACTDCGNNPCILAERPLRGMRTQGGCRCRDNIRAALADTASAARNHEARVRAKALREARDLARSHAVGNREAGEAWRGYAMAQEAIAGHLDKLADEAERGGA